MRDWSNAAEKATGLKSVGASTKRNRHAASLLLQVDGASTADITSMLGHKKTVTAEVNYADLPSRAASRSVAGWPAKGVIVLPRRALHSELVRFNGLWTRLLNSVVPFLTDMRTTFNRMNQEEQLKLKNEELLLLFFRESAAGLVETLAEILIVDPEREGKEAQLPIFNFPPFNGDERSDFQKFVLALKEKYGEFKTADQIIGDAYKTLSRGDVKEGFKQLATDLSKQVAELTTTVQTLASTLNTFITSSVAAGSGGGGGFGGGSGGGGEEEEETGEMDGGDQEEPAPLQIDNRNTSTWPKNDPSWVNASKFQLNPSLGTLIDVFDFYHKGWMDFATLKDLEHEYSSTWRRYMDKGMRQKVLRIKKIALCMATRADAAEHQRLLYECHNATTHENKMKLHTWSKLRRYLDDVLLKQKEGYQGRSEKMQKVRQKRQNTASSSTSNKRHR